MQKHCPAKCSFLITAESSMVICKAQLLWGRVAEGLAMQQ